MLLVKLVDLLLPVLLHSHCTFVVAYDQLPVLVVDNWSDVTPSLIRQFYREYLAKRTTYNYHKLFADYWIGEIAVQQERCLAQERARHAPAYSYSYSCKGGWCPRT